MKVSTPFTLLGAIATAEISESDAPANRHMILTIDVGQPEHVTLQIPITTGEGQKTLGEICRRAGVFALKDTADLIGRKLSLELVQMQVQAGLVQPLICVGVA